MWDPHGNHSEADCTPHMGPIWIPDVKKEFLL